ncbi:AAA family ATPase [Pseudomonas argentinensis]|uniref:AAA domain-containing protein n=1 Tax=Phytopseudomonas argentinensis TaxID=289370 RepID=A0A1I3MGD4_9GAMM|nr:AAA domain-containing protein [Pseudomonas argentinensis]KAB0546843.1 AAA family ATPase [Pseudomonas argentinensis]SFI96023.1 AAA domain-containing protein [Pseudomonas argentinensis]
MQEHDARIARLLAFYRSAYLADSRDLNLDNLSTLAAGRLAWLDGREELASGALPLLALAPGIGAELERQQRLYQRELQLVYGVLPVCGRLSGGDGPATAFCAPLVYYEATLNSGSEGNAHLLAIDPSQPLANWRLLRQLLVDADTASLDDLPLADAPIDSHGLGDLLGWISRRTRVTDVLTASGFPALEDQQAVDQALRRRSLSLRAAAFVALVPRGSGSRGIVHELQQLQETRDWSAPLCQLLGEPQPVSPQAASAPEALPAQLSQAQSQALANAARYPLSQVSGPPGTGKSYTLAALALDRYLHGESVLLVSRSAQAVRVIGQKLREDFGLHDAVLESDGGSLQQTLRDRLASLLQGQLPSVTADAELQLQRALQQLIEQEQSQAKALARRSEQALRWSRLILRAERGTLGFWRRHLLLPWVRRRVRHSVRPWALLDELRECQQRRERLSRDYLNTRRAASLSGLLAGNRQLFVQYNQAIRARQSQRQLALFEDINPQLLLAAFPIWVVTLDELHRLLPLKPGLFDVMVMDEATQCDIASALPAFQRCRRAVISGDARQLRHLSFLSRHREGQLLQRSGLPGEERERWSYRDNSVLDLVGLHLPEQRALTFLDEHFRSRPALIRFSNQRFYDNRLRVMKERPGLTHCDSLQLQRLTGERAGNGVNQVELEHVLQLIDAHIERYADSPVKPSIGVVSPFRDQVEAIRQRIAGLDLQRLRDFRVLVDTPYGFQGEERDLMIISFALDASSSQAAVYLNRQDMFNVAITRARERQVLLFSGDERQLPADHLLRRYLESAAEPSTPRHQQPEQDAFERALCTALEAHGVLTWTRYPLAGLLLDLFCQRGDKCLAIDLIGFPGDGEGFLELERYRVLARAGLEVVPLSYGLWAQEPDRALQALLQRL